MNGNRKRTGNVWLRDCVFQNRNIRWSYRSRVSWLDTLMALCLSMFKETKRDHCEIGKALVKRYIAWSKRFPLECKPYLWNSDPIQHPAFYESTGIKVAGFRCRLHLGNGTVILPKWMFDYKMYVDGSEQGKVLYKAVVRFSINWIIWWPLNVIVCRSAGTTRRVMSVSMCMTAEFGWDVLKWTRRWRY